MQNMYMYNVSSHAQYNVSVPPLCAKWSMAKFQLEVLHPNTRSSVAQICNLRPQRNHFLCPPVYICPPPLSCVRNWRTGVWRSGDKAVEGSVQNGHNGCIRRPHHWGWEGVYPGIEMGGGRPGYADQASAIFTSCQSANQLYFKANSNRQCTAVKHCKSAKIPWHHIFLQKSAFIFTHSVQLGYVLWMLDLISLRMPTPIPTIWCQFTQIILRCSNMFYKRGRWYLNLTLKAPKIQNRP